MDEFKAEKANATRSYNYNLFTAISRTCRIAELFIALLLLSWILTRLPCAFNLSAEYIRKLSAVAGNPLFVFALSNAIIAALLARSGRLSPAADNADGLYDELLKGRHAPPAAGELPRAAEAEFVDKQVVSETSAAVVEDRTCEEKDIRAVEDGTCAKDSGSCLRRSESEKWRREGGKVVRRRLRRSETEKRRESLYPQDKLSSEEFQRTIDAFIAKQMRFLKEESSDIVVQNPS